MRPCNLIRPKPICQRPTRRKRRRFQFRLRTLSVIVAIVAVQCAVCLLMLREWQRQSEEVERHERVRAILNTWQMQGGVSGGTWGEFEPTGVPSLLIELGSRACRAIRRPSLPSATMWG
jgi:hypothetical protein